MNGSRKRVIVGAGAALENAMFLPGRKTYDFVLSSKRQESFILYVTKPTFSNVFS